MAVIVFCKSPAHKGNIRRMGIAQVAKFALLGGFKQVRERHFATQPPSVNQVITFLAKGELDVALRHIGHEK
jgi:hypothetical protein